MENLSDPLRVKLLAHDINDVGDGQSGDIPGSILGLAALKHPQRVRHEILTVTEKTALSYVLVFAEPVFQFVLFLLLPLRLNLLGVWLTVPLAQVLEWVVSFYAKRVFA